MARDPERARRDLNLSASDVDQRWTEIVDNLFKPELDRSSEAWTELGERYSNLGERRAR